MQFRIDQRMEICSQMSQTPSLGRTRQGDLLLLYANYPDCMAGCRMFLIRSTNQGQTWPGHSSS